MKSFLITIGVTILLIFASFIWVNYNDYYMRDTIFYDVEYRDLFIKELEKHDILFYVNKDNLNHLIIKSNNSGKIEEISKIALSKASQHQFKDFIFKNKFLKKLDENNISYIENVISENPPDYRIRLNEKDMKKSKLLIEELLF